MIDMLWEDDQPDDPERALRNLVYRLRHVLDPEGSSPSLHIVLSRGFYQFNTSADYWLDTEEFEQKRVQAKNLSRTDPLASIQLYKGCLSLYKGEYLPGQVYADWILPARNYYRRLFLQTVLDYLALLKTMDDLPAIREVCEDHQTHCGPLPKGVPCQVVSSMMV